MEHFNRVLTDMLSMYTSADHRDWDLVLPYVTLAHNSSCHDTSGFSPFDILFGHEAWNPHNASLTIQKNHYNRSRCMAHFSPGSFVLLWSTSRRVGLSEKLLPPYSEFYSVVAPSVRRYIRVCFCCRVTSLWFPMCFHAVPAFRMLISTISRLK